MEVDGTFHFILSILVMNPMFILLVLKSYNYGELVHFVTLLMMSKLSSFTINVQLIVMSLCT
jgi:hypothetical protein